MINRRRLLFGAGSALAWIALPWPARRAVGTKHPGNPKVTNLESALAVEQGVFHFEEGEISKRVEINRADYFWGRRMTVQLDSQFAGQPLQFLVSDITASYFVAHRNCSVKEAGSVDVRYRVFAWKNEPAPIGMVTVRASNVGDK